LKNQLYLISHKTLQTSALFQWNL